MEPNMERNMRVMASTVDSPEMGRTIARCVNLLPLLIGCPGAVFDRDEHGYDWGVRLATLLRYIYLCGDIKQSWPITDYDEILELLRTRWKGPAREWVQRPPQTNQVMRGFPLFLALQFVAATLQRTEVVLREIGASAGFNLNLDRYSFEATSGGWHYHCGAETHLTLSMDIFGSRLKDAVPITISDRRGCDLQPVVDTLRLEAFVWGDEGGNKLANLRAARDILDRFPVVIDKQDAESWIEQHLRYNAHQEMVVLQNSMVLQYFDDEKLERFTKLVYSIGATQPLAWIRLEPAHVLGWALPSVTPFEYALDVVFFPGGERRLLARYNGTQLQWLV